MCREELDGSVRDHAQLYARAPQLHARDSLLDDSAPLREFVEVLLEGHFLELEAHRPHATLDLGDLAGRPRRGKLAKIDDGIAHAGDALVQLHDRLTRLWPLRTQARQRGDEGLEAVDVLISQRMGDALLCEESTAAGFCAVGQMPRIGAEERDAEHQGEVAFEPCHVVRDKVGKARVGDQPSDSLDQPRSLQHLRRQRDRRCVEGRDEVESLTCMTRYDTREQREVVLDDRGVDLRRRHIDHVQPRLSEEEKEEQQALFVRLHRCAPVDDPIERYRGNHDDRLAGEVHPHCPPDRRQPLLQRVEPLLALTLAQGCERQRLRREHTAHTRTRAASTPTISCATTGRENPFS